MFGSAAAKASAFESKLILYIVLGVLALVIINLLLDGIRRYIRGLDTAGLGAIFIFLGYKASGFKMVSALTNLLYLVGGTLFASGILIFVLMLLFRRRRSAKRSGPPMPKHAEKSEKTKAPEPEVKEEEKQ